MSLRKAADQLGSIPFVLYGAVLWTVVIGVSVATTMQPATYDAGVGGYVGQTFYSGLIGLGVLAVFASILLYLVSEAGQEGPAPETFPPEE